MQKHFLKSYDAVLGSFIIGCPWALILVLPLSWVSFQTSLGLDFFICIWSRISDSFAHLESQMTKIYPETLKLRTM